MGNASDGIMDTLPKPPKVWRLCPVCEDTFSELAESGMCWRCDSRAIMEEKAEARKIRRHEAWKAYEASPTAFWQEDQSGVLGRMRGGSIESVPSRYWQALTDIELHPDVSGWDGSDPWCVTFQGPNGRGKTWAAARTLTHAMIATRTLSFRWWRSGALITEFKLAIGKGNGSGELIESLRSGVLVLDDLGAVRETDFSADVIREALMYREENLMPTILTLDVPLSKIEPRLESRIRAGIVVSIDGPDRRKGSA